MGLNLGGIVDQAEVATAVEESRAEPKLVAEVNRFDWVNPLAILVLGIMSTAFIYSAQAYTQGGHWKMQIIWFCLGFAAYLMVSFTDYRLLLRYAHYLYGAGVLLLLLVFFGPEVYGSRRWINFGLFKAQPTELAKIGALVLSASILARSEIGSVRDSLKGIIKVSGCFLLPMFLIFLQPDLGSALVFPPMVFSLLYVAKVPVRFFVGAFAIFLAFVAVIGSDVYGYYQYLNEKGASSDDQGRYEDQSLIPLKDSILHCARSGRPTRSRVELEPQPSVDRGRFGRINRQGVWEWFTGWIRLLATSRGPQRFSFRGNRGGIGIFGRRLRTYPICRHSMQLLADSKHGSRPFRRFAGSRGCRVVNGSRFHQRGHDNRDHPNNRITVAIFELRRILSAQLLHHVGSCPERVSIPQGFLVNESSMPYRQA